VLGKLVYSPNDKNRFRLTVDHLDRDVDWTVLSAIAKPPLASTSVIGLTAFDKIKRDRVSFDHRYDGGEGLISAAAAPSTGRRARPASSRPRTARPPPTAPATPPSTTASWAPASSCTASSTAAR
jgi:hemoglobin/transferrin/lactoferrin receptor protein